MGITRFERQPATGGGEFLPAVPLDAEPVEGWTGGALPKAPAGVSHGYQSIARKIARQVSTTGTYYPDDGGGTTAASAASGQTNIQLSATVLQSQAAGLDATGLLLAGRYATAPDLWEIVRIVSWTAGTQTVVANRNLTNTWASGAKYHLLCDIRLAASLHILSEFSAATTTMNVDIMYFDWAVKPDGTARDPIRTLDLESVLSNSAIQGAAGEVQETNYYYGRIRSRPVQGFMGAKVRPKTVANGNVSLWYARS